jgi:hypothetical protein
VPEPTLDLQAALGRARLAGDPGAAAAVELAFLVSVPPVGYATFTLRLVGKENHSTTGTSNSSSTSSSGKIMAAAGSTVVLLPGPPNPLGVASPLLQLSTGVLNVTLDPVSGRFTTLSASDGRWRVAFTQELLSYRGHLGADAAGAAVDGSPGSSSSSRSSSSSSSSNCPRASNCLENERSQASGAYIFRPAAKPHDAAMPLAPAGAPLHVAVLTGPVITQVTQIWASGASLTTRLWAGSVDLDQEWTIGPLPGLGQGLGANMSQGLAGDDTGHEVVLRTLTDLQTGVGCGVWLIVATSAPQLQLTYMQLTWCLWSACVCVCVCACAVLPGKHMQCAH